ncbi:MAG: glycosyltransferase [Pseudomonadota bacterium]
MSEFQKISVIVPAHNEERHIGNCLQAIQEAAKSVTIEVEAVVVLNRCSDGTENIAKEYGAVCIPDDSRCIAKIRNKGVYAATGEIVVTCDADSRLHNNALAGILEALSSGKTIGGGMSISFDRKSTGIYLTEIFFNLMIKVTGLPCGAFWTTKAAFCAVKGFDESLVMSEDLDFAKRLRTYGKSAGKKYVLLKNSPLETSSRKFDRFGDWSFFKMIFIDAYKIRRSLKGKDTEFVDEYFYDFNDKI